MTDTLTPSRLATRVLESGTPPDIRALARAMSPAPGWAPLVEIALRAAVGSEEWPQVDFGCKDKYGTLRFEWVSAPAALCDLLDALETLSGSMCEVCGGLGRAGGRDWVRTLCPGHVRALALAPRDRVALYGTAKSAAVLDDARRSAVPVTAAGREAERVQLLATPGLVAAARVLALSDAEWAAEVSRAGADAGVSGWVDDAVGVVRTLTVCGMRWSCARVNFEGVLQWFELTSTDSGDLTGYGQSVAGALTRARKGAREHWHRLWAWEQAALLAHVASVTAEAS